MNECRRYAAVYSLIDLLGNWHPLPSEHLISSWKEKSLIPERVSLHSFQQVSGKTHFDKSFVGGPYLRWYMRAFPALKTGNSLSDTLVWGNRYTSHIHPYMNPISGYFCSRCKSPTITLQIRRKEGEKTSHFKENQICISHWNWMHGIHPL